MSGVFLVVKDAKGVLHEVAGDPPHVTVFYSGDAVPRKNLVTLGNHWMRYYWPAEDCDLVLDRAQISSFTKADGTERHDVLLLLNDPLRIVHHRKFAKEELGVGDDVLFMMIPHVTAAACATREEAETRTREFEAHLPLTVRVVGYTVN